MDKSVHSFIPLHLSIHSQTPTQPLRNQSAYQISTRNRATTKTTLLSRWLSSLIQKYLHSTLATSSRLSFLLCITQTKRTLGLTIFISISTPHNHMQSRLTTYHEPLRSRRRAHSSQSLFHSRSQLMSSRMSCNRKGKKVISKSTITSNKRLI